MTVSRLELSLSKKDRIITSTSSKGNQIKWFANKLWIKANNSGYEDIAEWVAYNLLLCSNLPQQVYVPYFLCKAVEDTGKVFNACYSYNFLGSDDTLVTLHKLLTRNGVDLDSILKQRAIADRIQGVVFAVYKLTKIDITEYLRVIITLDALILNEDRHLNNIALIYNRNYGYRLCPIFDNGLSLLSDVKEYDYVSSTPANILTVQAKPFSLNFDKQLEVLGQGFLVNKNAVLNFIEENKDIVGRVAEVLEYQITKYTTIFI